MTAPLLPPHPLLGANAPAPPPPVAGEAELRAAADRAFRALQRSCEALAAQIPADRRPPVMMMAYHLWALSHGVTALFGRGDEARRRAPISAEDLLEAGAAIYLRGVGLIPEDA